MTSRQPQYNIPVDMFNRGHWLTFKEFVPESAYSITDSNANLV